MLQILAMLQIFPEPQSSCLLNGNPNTNLLVCLGLEKVYIVHLGINLQHSHKNAVEERTVLYKV